jgi:hypothetical protein
MATNSNPHGSHRNAYRLIAIAHGFLAGVAALEPVLLIAASEALIAVTYLYLASRPGA